MSVPPIPWPGGKRLRHVKQLQTGSRTSGTDCGPSSDLMALQAASGAAIRPNRADQAEWIDALRDQMPHGPTWPATRLSDQRAAINSTLVRGAYLPGGHKRPLSATSTTSHEHVVELLKRGFAIVVAINYGTLNDLMPQLSGSPTFRGGHAIFLQGFKDGFTRLGDPLHDGRRAGIPRGWQTVRVRRYLQAAETWGSPPVGNGRAAILAVAPAEDL